MGGYKDGVCVVRVTGQRGPCIVQGLSVGRERRPGLPVSKRPPCFMHSVLCDDKRQRGGWNAGLQGPGEGWAYERLWCSSVQFCSQWNGPVVPGSRPPYSTASRADANTIAPMLTRASCACPPPSKIGCKHRGLESPAHTHTNKRKN